MTTKRETQHTPITPTQCECAGNTLYELPHPRALRYCALHAATPKLLAALQEVAEDYANMCDPDDAESDGARLLAKMRAAIRKATS